jgi:hypothetical protein
MPVCRTPRYSPPVHMIKLTKEREIAPYVWVHPACSFTVSLPRARCWVCALVETARRIPVPCNGEFRWPHKS